MAAFQSGFQLGQRAYQQNLDNQDRERVRKRQDEKYQWEVEDRERLAKDRTNIDTAINSFQATQGGIYDGRQAKFDTPMPEGEMGPQMQSAMPNPAAGLTPRAPTTLETNRGLAGIAVAQRDVNAMGSLAKEAGTLRTGQEDADFVRRVIENPDGPEAKQSRTFINNSSSSLGIDPPDPKTGLSTMRIIKGDRTKPVDLSPADLGKVTVGVRRLMRGDMAGLDLISAVNKELAAAAAAEFKLDLDVLKGNNDVVGERAKILNDAQRTRNDTTRTNIAGANSRRAGEQSRRLSEFVNAKGETVLVDTSVLKSNPDGTVPIPAGLRPKTARPEISIKDVREYATELRNSVNPVTGKAYTPEQAMTESRRLLSGQEDPFTARLNSLLGDGADPFAPAPARTQGMSTPGQAPAAPRRQIGSIVPPRSAADMVPRQPMSDDDIILNYLSK